MTNYDLEKLVASGEIVSYRLENATGWSRGEVYITFPSGLVLNIAGCFVGYGDPADITIDVY